MRGFVTVCQVDCYNLLFRLKLQTCVSKVLEKIEDVSEEWVTNGRFCSPRVLWFFENCPPAFRRQIAKYEVHKSKFFLTKLLTNQVLNPYYSLAFK